MLREATRFAQTPRCKALKLTILLYVPLRQRLPSPYLRMRSQGGGKKRASGGEAGVPSRA